MKILWVPHSSWRTDHHQRDQYLIQRLATSHEVHVGLWEICLRRIDYLNPIKYISSLRYHQKHQLTDNYRITIHHIPRVLDITYRARKDPTEFLSYNERLFQDTIRRIVRKHGIEALICGPNAPLLGFPPSLSIPIVFDYLDGGVNVPADNPWWKMEEEYFRRADGVLCISQGMIERVQSRGKEALLLPNGADLKRFQAASGERVRKELGLTGRKVVSLIGLTCSERPYFIKAVEKVRQNDPAAACLLVGNKRVAKRLLSHVSPDHRQHFIYAGEIPYEKIADYFAASDVGVYPVEEEPYYEDASPIKVFEYAAAGKPVVAPRLRELRRLGLAHLKLVPPTETGFADGIHQALRQGRIESDDLKEFDWMNLSRKLECFLKSLTN
jgi:glycosyltransferase involved in cell wall biosynthesis